MNRKRRITKAYFDFARNKYALLIQILFFRMGIDISQKNQANEELLKCMICYDGSTLFTTFLYGRLFGVFRNIRKREYKSKLIQSVPIDSLVNIAGPDCDMDRSIMIEECLECLDSTEHKVITELFFEGKTISKVSQDHNMVNSTVHRTRERALNKMRQKCGVE